MDLFKMATQIANGMSQEDKDAIENMDMEKMISHVSKNVFKMMNGNGSEINGNLSDLMGSMNVHVPRVPEPIMPKTRDICFDLNVDLVDFYTSKKKKINIKRKVIVEMNGKQKIVEEKKKIVVQIEKGMKDEQVIKFEGEADQIPGYIPGDIIITLIENEHPFFQRDNDNLIIVKNVNLYQIYEYSFDITHLDSRIIRVTKNNSDALHLNDSLRKISGQGMPVYKHGTYGDLFIRFNVVIPKSIEPSVLGKLKEIFDDSPEDLSDDYICEVELEQVTETDLEELDSESESEFSDSELSEASEISVSSSSEKEYSRRKR